MHEDQQPPTSQPLRNFSANGINDRLILERITILMSHYWAADEPQAVRKAQLGDWLDDLREFSAVVVAGACQEWRRGQNRRPTIADIRKLCLEARPMPASIGKPKHTPSRPSPNIVREGYERLPIRLRSDAEIALDMRKLDDLAEAAGFGRGSLSRYEYVKAQLRATRPELTHLLPHRDAKTPHND